MHINKKWLWTCLGVVLLTSWVGMVVTFILLNHNIARQKELLKVLEDDISLVQEAIFAEKIESIVQNCTTDQERALAVARWTAASTPNKDSARTMEGFATRTGKCGTRSNIFVKAMGVLYIPAQNFNMYNFGGVGGGHSCVQAFYGGKWHFFDVTYAGCFIKNGDVLSWEEIVANPEEALRYLVVFPKTLDRSGPYQEHIDNEKRMRAVYTARAIGGSAEQAGPARESLKIFNVKVDAAALPFVVGDEDDDATDVQEIGLERKLSENLQNTLSTLVDFFHVRWRLHNLTVGKSYRLTYTLLEPRKQKMPGYWAKATGAQIISGDVYTGSAPGTWTIEFTAQSPEASILCGYDLRKIGVGPAIDSITISALP